MHIREIFGKKTAVWSQYEKPTLRAIINIAEQEFPGVPLDLLTITADIDNDGRSVETMIHLHQ